MKTILSFVLVICILFSCAIFWGCEEEFIECFYCDNGADMKADYRSEKLSTTATCTQSGTMTLKCKYCKRTAKIEVEALGHDFDIVKDEANCLMGGNTYYACSRKNCDETKTEWSKASPLKHEWIETYSKETVAYKYSDYRCFTCGETKTDKTKVDMGSSVKKTEEEFYYATGAAIKIVKEQLKYPSSSKFIKESQMEVHHNLWTGNYYIEGAVSAPNAFGVYTDFYFIVKTKIRVTGDKFTWYDYDCVLEEG